MIIPFSVDTRVSKKQVSLMTNLGKDKEFPFLNIGANSYIVSATSESAVDVHEGFVYSLQVGKFCSLAHNLCFVIDMNHDYLGVSTAGMKFDLFQTGPFRLRRKGEIIIQNDVWIGRGSTIMGGVTIGNGAVVATNSLVTKDVEPYSIVGGSPAKIIKYRFPPEIIEKLQIIQWWYWSDEKIRQRKKWFETEIHVFADHFYQEALDNKKKQQKALALNRKKNEYLYFMDIAEPYNLWKKVIRMFCEKHKHDTDYGLILFLQRDEHAEKNCRLVERFVEPIDAACDVFLYFGEPDDVPAIFAYADVLITNRSSECVYHSCMADLYGMKKVAAVDIPIFDQ